MNQEGETRQRLPEPLDNGGEPRRRPPLARSAGAGMHEQEPRAIVPALSSKREPRLLGDRRRDDDRHAKRALHGGRADRLEQMLPDRPVDADRWGDDGAGDQRRELLDKVRLARTDPGDHACGPAQILTAPRRPTALRAHATPFEQRGEPEGFEVGGPIHDAERGQEPGDPRLRREHEWVVSPATFQGAERRDRQEDVAQRSGVDDERQGRRSASAASCRRPFVASAVPV